MKAALIVLAVLQIISGLVTAVAVFTQNIFLGILSAAIVVLGLVPIFALIRCMEELDGLRYQYIRLEGKLHRMEKELGAVESPVMTDGKTKPIAQPPVQTAKQRWTCPKCQSINTEGTSSCQECGARYTSDIGSVEERPLTKWKLKEYKKKKQ